MSKYLNKKYIINYKKQDGTFRVYNASTKQISTMERLPEDIPKFKMLTTKDSQATDEGLLQYAEEFKEWNRELRYNKICSMRYSECYNDFTAVTRYFNRTCKYADHDPITPTEFRWFEQCANSGLQYLKKCNYTKTGYGYDFKNFYALILSSNNLIPTKEGSETTLKELPKRKNLKHGFYRVNITCNNDNFRKIFTFSSNNVYLNVSLYFALKHRKEYDVKINLIVDDKPNAYIYDDKDMVSLNSITNRWFTELTDLRKVYPKNRLIKHLLSSTWSSMNAHNTVKKTLKEIQDEKIDVGITMDDEYQIHEYHEYANREYYELLKTKSPYKFNIRLKP